MDESISKHLKVMTLSEAIRVGGYTAPHDYNECVLGCAYRALTGRPLQRDAHALHQRSLVFAANTFGVPVAVAEEAEHMCINLKPPSAIADYVASEGY